MRVAADVGHLALADAVEHVAAGELQPPGRALRACRQQVHDRQRGQRLAAAGFADDAHRLAAIDMKRHALHRMQRARRHRQVDAQVLDREDALAHGSSVIPSPRGARYRDEGRIANVCASWIPPPLTPPRKGEGSMAIRSYADRPWPASHAHLRFSGAVTSRRPSPSMLMASTSSEQRDARNGDQPGIEEHQALGLRDHQAPGRRRRLHAEPQERQRRFEQDRVRHLQRRHHDQVVDARWAPPR